LGNSPTPRILIIDIENSPNIGYAWEKYQVDVIEFLEEWHLLSVAWSWLDESKIHVKALPDFPSLYQKDPKSDHALVGEVHALLSEADIVIGHNSLSFDIPKIQARMIANGFLPPEPFLQVDTFREAKKHFKFTTNTLNDICARLGIGKKVQTGGFELWKGCLANDAKSWELMRRYNVHDVKLTKALYLRLRPWMTSHPAIGLMSGNMSACPKCGSTKPLQKRGVRYTKVGIYQSYQCKECGGFCRARLSKELPDKVGFVS
jgi:DNA polymerase elongation subunit (family B)